MVATSYGFLKDPAPFLQFFLSIGVTFILGASASSVMNSWKVQSVSASEIVHADEEQTLNQNVNEHIEEEYVEKTPRPKDLDDSSLD